MNTQFNVGDIVYLKSSARNMGYIEKYRINEIKTEDGLVIYGVNINPVPQHTIATGNYISHNPFKTIWFYEDQLSDDLEEIVQLAIRYHQGRISYLQSLISGSTDG